MRKINLSDSSYITLIYKKVYFGFEEFFQSSTGVPYLFEKPGDIGVFDIPFRRVNAADVMGVLRQI